MGRGGNGVKVGALQSARVVLDIRKTLQERKWVLSLQGGGWTVPQADVRVRRRREGHFKKRKQSFPGHFSVDPEQCWVLGFLILRSCKYFGIVQHEAGGWWGMIISEVGTGQESDL